MASTDASGTRIAWEERGTGDPVLLIMGAGMTRQMWHHTVPALAEQHRVLWYDNRGFGDSAHTSENYTVRDMVEDAVAVLDAAGVHAAHVYGVSMGGLQAQELALTYPDRVKSIVLGCTWAAAPDRRRASWGVSTRLRLPRRIELFLLKSTIYGPKRDKNRMRQDLVVLRANPADRTMGRAQLAAGFAYSSRDRLARLRAPALVLHGDHDRVIPYSWGQELAQHLPQSRFVTLEGAGHNFLSDSADEANAAVLEFLRVHA
jgi:3-oxoadipate enol-lactonase